MNKKLLSVVIAAMLAAAGIYAAAVFAAAPESAVSGDASPAAEAPTGAPASEAPAAPAPKDPEKVLARVEGHEIKEKDVDMILQAIGPQYAMMYDNEQGRKALLDDLVANRLFALSGQKQGLADTPEFKGILDTFVTQTIGRMAMEKVIQDVTVSDEECKKFYDENPERFTAPEQIRASHILLADDVTSADKAALIMEEIAKGVSFDVLAKEHSIDPSAQQNGGDLGFFGKGQMVPEFETAAFALQQPGDTHPFVKSSFGWHFIRLEEKRPSSVVPYEDVKPQIEQNLTNEKQAQKYEEAVEALKKEYKVELLTGAQ